MSTHNIGFGKGLLELEYPDSFVSGALLPIVHTGEWRAKVPVMYLHTNVLKVKQVQMYFQLFSHEFHTVFQLFYYQY